MGAFTPRLKEVLEITGGTWRFEGGNTIIEGGNIGIDYFPIFDESYRARLRGLIFDRYMNQEIAHDSIEMFQQRMRTVLNERMPLFNEWYKSTRLSFDPLRTVDLRTLSIGTATQESESEGLSSTTSTSEGVSKAKQNDYPQTELVDGSEYASSGSRADSKTDSDADSNESSSAKVDSASDSDTHVTGYQGLPSDMVVRLRESFVNVDTAVLDSLERLFMGVWDNADSYTRNGHYL